MKLNLVRRTRIIAARVQGAALRPKSSSIHQDQNLPMHPTSYLRVLGLKTGLGRLPVAAAGDNCMASVKTTVTRLYKTAMAHPGLVS